MCSSDLLDDAFMSKFHAQIEIIVNEDQSGIDYYLSDMQSTNHTYINQALIEHTCLSHNDIVVIGKSKFVFLSAGVREYLSLEKLRRHSVDLSAKESDESLSIALEEITEEIKSPDADELVNPVYASESGQYKFSRRLNSY